MTRGDFSKSRQQNNFTITTESRIENGNEILIAADSNQQDMTPQSTIDQKLDISTNTAFEPFEINVYHKKRKTAADLLNESFRE